MANMGYCRFHNTVGDLEDCLEHLQDDLPAGEANARLSLIEICRNILRDVRIDVEDKEPEFD
jgi:hypothetical protein